MDPGCQTSDGGAGRQDLKVLHRFRVAPELPPGTGSEAPPPPSVATLELTPFDIFFLFLSPAQRLFLYRLPARDDGSSSSRDHFLEFHLPRLNRALSHALAVFYPLAGHLVRPDPDAVPVIRYEDGDAVDVTVVESQDDFEELAGDAPKESSRFFLLVPDLTPSQETKQPALAVQVTLFPGPAVAVGVTVNHGVADGLSSTHFVKTWAAFCRQLLSCDQGDGGGGAGGGGQGMDDANNRKAQPLELPIYDRSLVQDPKGLRDIFFADITRALEGSSLAIPKPTITLYRATFSLSRADQDLLRRRAGPPPPGTRYSSFTLACALTWVCAVKARGRLEDAQKVFSFVSNLRPRIKPPLPAAYFGNCLGGSMAAAKTADLVGDEGLAVAAAAIWKEVQDLHDGGMFVRIGEDAFKAFTKESWADVISVAGSPSFRVYEVDFGWGRPVKVEVVSCEKSGGISLAETADGRGGIEVGMPLPLEAMLEFQRLWRSALGADG